jgi:hypothetical protein
MLGGDRGVVDGYRFPLQRLPADAPLNGLSAAWVSPPFAVRTACDRAIGADIPNCDDILSAAVVPANLSSIVFALIARRPGGRSARLMDLVHILRIGGRRGGFGNSSTS